MFVSAGGSRALEISPLFDLTPHDFFFSLTLPFFPPMSQNPYFPSIILILIIFLSRTLPFFPLCHKTHLFPLLLLLLLLSPHSHFNSSPYVTKPSFSLYYSSYDYLPLTHTPILPHVSQNPSFPLYLYHITHLSLQVCVFPLTHTSILLPYVTSYSHHSILLMYPHTD